MLNDEEEASGVEEERGELDGGTTTETQGDPQAQGSGRALLPPRDNQPSDLAAA